MCAQVAQDNLLRFAQKNHLARSLKKHFGCFRVMAVFSEFCDFFGRLAGRDWWGNNVHIIHYCSMAKKWRHINIINQINPLCRSSGEATNYYNSIADLICRQRRKPLIITDTRIRGILGLFGNTPGVEAF